MVGGTDERDRLDDLFETLADEQRRILVSFFADEKTNTFSVDELVTALCRRMDEKTGTRQRRNVEIDLRHRQLPKLAEAGIVEYETERNVVRYLADTKSTITTDRILSSVVELPAD